MQTIRLGLYSLLALTGITTTMYENILFITEHEGFSVVTYVQENYVNHASASIFNDLICASMTFLVWSYFESKRLGMRGWWIFLVLNFFVSFAFAFPLFLMVRDWTMHHRKEGKS